MKKIFKSPQTATILTLAMPIFVELFLGSLFGMVDMIMLGRYGSHSLSTSAIAVVGFTNQIMFIGLSLVTSLCTGATAIIARYLGMRREKQVSSVLSHIIILNLALVAIPFVVISIVFAEKILTALGAEANTISLGIIYYYVILIGFVFQAFNFSVFSAMRGSSDTKTPMKINLIVNIANVLGNAALIYGLGPFPELGVLGAGISTALSHVVATAISLLIILNPKYIIHLNLKKKFVFNKSIIQNLVKIGGPAALEQMAFRVGILRFVHIVASLGTTVYATHQICLNIIGLSFSTGQAFSTATSTLVGRSLGEQKPDLAANYMKRTRNIGMIAGLILGVIMFTFGGNIVGLYNKNPDVIASGATIMMIVAVIQPIQNAQFIIAGGLRGAGDTVWTLISTFISVFIIRIAMAKLFIDTFHLGLVGAWFAMLIDQFARFVFVNARYYSGKWKYISLK